MASTLPTLAQPGWEPNTSLLPANYVPPPGGPTLAELQASPLFRMMQSTAAGAPSSSLLKGWEQNTLPGVLSGAIPLNPPAYDPATMPPPPSWATHIAPTPGQPGWVDPVWGQYAQPMDGAPPAPFNPAPTNPGAQTPMDPPAGFNPRPGMGGPRAASFGGAEGTSGGFAPQGYGGGQRAPQAPQAPQPGAWGQQWGQFGGGQQQQQPGGGMGEQQKNPFSFGNSPWKSW
jgi:hypothetical protein